MPNAESILEQEHHSEYLEWLALGGERYEK